MGGEGSHKQQLFPFSDTVDSLKYLNFLFTSFPPSFSSSIHSSFLPTYLYNESSESYSIASLIKTLEKEKKNQDHQNLTPHFHAAFMAWMLLASHFLLTALAVDDAEL